MSPVSPPGPEPHAAPADRVARDTYRYLRVAPLVVALFLGASVTLQRSVAGGCSLGSISAYYFTAAHSVFVAALCAIGACLIVYKGNTDTEDVVLNFSGFLSFVVAFVPTQREAVCGAGLPAAYEVGPGVRNNVLALIVAGVLAEATRVFISRNVERQRASGWCCS